MKNRTRPDQTGKNKSMASYFRNLTTRLNISPQPFLFDNNDIRFSTRFLVTGNGELKTIQKAKLN